MINYSPTSLIRWHLKVNACHPYPRNDLFLIMGSSRISMQDHIADSAFLAFSAFSALSCFSMDKIKASQLGNWVLLFPTHPSWLSLHFPGLAFVSISLDKSLMIFLIREVIDWFGKFFSHLWGFIIFGKSTFLSFMSCLHTTRFYYEGCTIYVHYYSSLFKMEGYTPIFISSFMWFCLFSSLYFSCVCLWEFFVARCISCAYS